MEADKDIAKYYTLLPVLIAKWFRAVDYIILYWEAPTFYNCKQLHGISIPK
jgi:hypothetical protein